MRCSLVLIFYPVLPRMVHTKQAGHDFIKVFWPIYYNKVHRLPYIRSWRRSHCTLPPSIFSR